MCCASCGREGYQARLQSIRYGGETLELNHKDLKGSKSGVMFDSGTSFTYLVPEAYAAVLLAVSFPLSSSCAVCPLQSVDHLSCNLIILLHAWGAGGGTSFTERS